MNKFYYGTLPAEDPGDAFGGDITCEQALNDAIVLLRYGPEEPTDSEVDIRSVKVCYTSRSSRLATEPGKWLCDEYDNVIEYLNQDDDNAVTLTYWNRGKQQYDPVYITCGAGNSPS